LVVSGIYRDSGALFKTIETVAEENPLRSATSRIVIGDEDNRLREDFDELGDFAGAAFRVGFESEDSMLALHFSFLLADTTGR
jgi:hypothetical protein